MYKKFSVCKCKVIINILIKVFSNVIGRYSSPWHPPMNAWHSMCMYMGIKWQKALLDGETQRQLQALWIWERREGERKTQSCHYCDSELEIPINTLAPAICKANTHPWIDILGNYRCIIFRQVNRSCKMNLIPQKLLFCNHILIEEEILLNFKVPRYILQFWGIIKLFYNVYV